MYKHQTSLKHLFSSVKENKDLTFRLAKREFTQRFQGSFFGWSWAILTPLLTAIVFTFIFSAVFQARWQPGVQTGTFDFALILLTGVAIHSAFAEMLSRAPNLIIGNSSYVTKVIFPIEILPVVILINALLNMFLALGIVVLGNLILNGKLPVTIAFLPFILLPYLFFLLALNLFFGAVGVFFRDVSQLVGLLITLSMFLTPIFYPVSAVPPAFQAAMFLNPLTFVVEQTREVLLFGRAPDFWGLAIYMIASLVALAASYWFFQRLRKGFADVV
jgi:lipopolysaccharide transport system permease protein